MNQYINKTNAFIVFLEYSLAEKKGINAKAQETLSRLHPQTMQASCHFFYHMRNVEIKARVSDFVESGRTASTIAGGVD